MSVARQASPLGVSVRCDQLPRREQPGQAVAGPDGPQQTHHVPRAPP